MLVNRAHDHCIKYYLHGVFSIVDATDPKTDPTVNKALGSSLFMSYSTITEEEEMLVVMSGIIVGPSVTSTKTIFCFNGFSQVQEYARFSLGKVAPPRPIICTLWYNKVAL
jgi:hypothetical protein